MNSSEAIQQIEKNVKDYLIRNLKEKTHNIRGFEFEIKKIVELYPLQFKPEIDPAQILLEGSHEYSVSFNFLAQIPDKQHNVIHQKNIEGILQKLVVGWTNDHFQIETGIGQPILIDID